MRIKLAALALSSLLALASLARAQTPGFYILKDQSSPQQILSMKTYVTGGITTPSSISSDLFGNPLSGGIGTTNTKGTALYVQGVTGGLPIPVLITGTPSFNCSNCSGGGGGGVAVTYGAAIGSLGTPGGFKDATGNFQPNLGDVIAGQWVNIKGGSIANTSFGASQSGTWSVGITGTPTVTVGNASITVNGTFWQATQPVSIAAPVAVTGTFWQATQPVSGTVTANAGTNLNTSLLALESGGNLASINTKTPALGQALAAASVPVVLTAAQISTLTPLSSVTVTQATGSNLHVVCDSGCAISSNPTFGATFPTTGQPVGFSQGGNLVAMTGTSGSLNVNVSNTVPVTLASTTITGTVAVTESGTWNVGLSAGSNIVGKFGIDQTTPGTTNLVSIGTNGTVNPTTASVWGINTLGSTTVGESGVLALGAVTTAAPTYSNGQSNAFSLTAAGALRVDGSAVTQPVSLASTTITGSVAVTNAGTFAVQATVANGADTALGSTTDAVATTPATSSAASLVALAKAINNNVSSSIPAGPNNIGSVSPVDATTTPTTAAPTAGTFSQILAANSSRKACTIQNTSASLAYFYPAATGGSTSNAMQVGAGGTFSCNNGPIVLADAISATCASGTCSFVVFAQ
jgi:hypothetical protein